jgi:rhodanese-related sulfurtransferase
MEIQDVKDRLDQYQVVDVRDQAEWDTGHIAGALHMPLDRLSEQMGSLEAKMPVIVVCRTGKRSFKGAELMKGEGIDAESLDGGVTAWVAGGLALVDSDGRPGSVLGPQAEPEYLPPDLAATRDSFMEVIFGLQERYGNREPTDEEAKEFMREWLAEKGKSPEEIERTLAGDQ